MTTIDSEVEPFIHKPRTLRVGLYYSHTLELSKLY